MLTRFLLLSIVLLLEPYTLRAGELLGRPTDTSITVSVTAERELEVFFEYGVAPGRYSGRTAAARVAAGDPIQVLIDGLKPDTAYSYRMRFRTPGAAQFTAGEEHRFHTQPPPGATFTFAVQADPHLDDGSASEVYKRSLHHALASSPDFLIDLGDTFMSDKLESQTWDEVVRRHLLARSYYELVGASLPLFLVLGNHEGETVRRLDGTADNLAVLATKARKLYYPNPEPNHFYSGNAKAEPFVGLRQNYYAWTWGDALFVVLDPYWYSTARPGQGGDNWYWTLGREQYDWLRRSLEGSRAKFKFVFAHNLVGGLNLDGRARGGIEGAPYFEWGGHNQDGTWGFSEKRPGWEMPIHHLLVKHNVTAFFHGHDHLYAKQDLDGIVYQEVPQPSHGRTRNPFGQYAYTHGDILPGSGYMRIQVSPGGVKAEFIRTDEGAAVVAHSYSIAPRVKNASESPTSVLGSKVAPAPADDQPAPPRRGAKKGGGRTLGKQPPPAERNKP